jgi:hypothetical protein
MLQIVAVRFGQRVFARQAEDGPDAVVLIRGSHPHLFAVCKLDSFCGHRVAIPSIRQ